MVHSDLKRSGIFAGMAPDDVDVIAAVCEERMLLAGEDLFFEGDDGDSLWLIQSGSVDIYKNIRGDVDRSLASLAAGEVIGEISFIDGSRRSAGARTAEASEFLVLSSTAFQRVLQDRPEVAAAFFRNLSAIVASRLRTTNDLYRESVAFSIEATGAGRLNLLILSEELRPVTIELASGSSVSGRILQMDNSPAGYTLILKDDAGKVAIIPYHAVQRIELA